MRSLFRIFCLVTLLFQLAVVIAAQPKLTYMVQYSTEHAGRIRVRILPSSPITSPVTMVFPRAIPSGYAQEFYDRYVDQVKATTSVETPVKKQDGPRWRVEQSGLTRIEYEVDVARLEQEIFDASAASKVRSEYVGLLGYSVLGYLEGFENLPVRLEVDGPQGWPVFTTLAPKVPTDRTKTSAEARNFYELADSQIVMGLKLEVRRLPTPVPLFLAVYAEVPTDVKKHGEIFADAFMKVLAYFSIGPFDHYTAYIEILKPLSERHTYGFSMEHLTSSTYFLGTNRALDANTSPEQLEVDRFNFAHHVTHSWIPKHVYGTGYMPFTWELAPEIDTIWFNEGFARYVAIEALADAMPAAEGKKFRQQRLDSCRRLIDSMPGFISSMSLLKLSRIGSLMYSDDFRVGQTLFSKGALMAAAMDESIRKQTHGRKRLRDSLRALMAWSERSGRAFRVAELPGLIARPVGVKEQSIRMILNEWLKGN
jgi:predicted metalloprotease with PDZ domain